MSSAASATYDGQMHTQLCERISDARVRVCVTLCPRNNIASTRERAERSPLQNAFYSSAIAKKAVVGSSLHQEGMVIAILCTV